MGKAREGRGATLGAAKIKAKLAVAEGQGVFCRGGLFLRGWHTQDQLPGWFVLMPAKEVMD